MLNILRLTRRRISPSAGSLTHHFSSAASESNLTSLEQYGFTESQLKTLSIRNAGIISTDEEKSIKPALISLVALGFSSTELVQIVKSSKGLSDRSAENMKLLEEYLGSKECVRKAIVGAPVLLRLELETTVLPNLRSLREYGVPNFHLARMAGFWPRGMTMKNESVIKSVIKLKEIGIEPSHSKFIYGLRAILGVSKLTWERRIALFQSFGCTEEEIMSAFLRQPLFMARSDEKITKILRFFDEKVKIDPPFMLQQPEVFGMSLEKRIIPRFSVINLLVLEGILDKRPGMYGLLTMANKNFEERFVSAYEKQVPKVVKAFAGKIKFNGFKVRKNKD